MSPRRLWAIARKEFIHILRDPRSLAMAIALPMMQLVLFGYALTLDVDRVPLVVWDQDLTPASRELVSRFLGSRYFSLAKGAGSYWEVERALDKGEALAALIIPSGFSRWVESFREAQVQFVVDGSDSNTATLALGYADVVVSSFSKELMIASMRRLWGQPMREPLVLEFRAWFNEELQSRNYIVPGLVAVIMNVIAALITSLTIAREWENGTMEQLVSTPLRTSEMVLGKLFPYFAIGLVDVAIAVAMGKLLFHVPFRGNLFLLFAVASVFLVGVLSIGLALSIITRNQLLASQGAMVITYLPALLLSGYIFAIQNMPQALQLISRVVPARYFVKIIRAIYLKGLGLEALAAEIALLLGFAFAVLILAHTVFRRTMA
jgi:ABC-2 type transport system permease protein